ncbi:MULTISPECIES: hypothetical protein [unclassified Microbacterium]|uniref:hypothetical protein n=1 Tax=unclassified Microbacterium TaxID=2609290 RepID=UPI00214B6AC1|nr:MULTISPECIES: hypothetical protein [unclassified Microbacterium]MCR2785537.1 hypothetical protein [Microbacterium sp. zg.B96]WIM17475.1 hypothetical protein QNO11_07545 [Microbacterium sp. zg-B96]
MPTNSVRIRSRGARLPLVAALLVAALGILIQFLTGVPGFPAVPPGPIILTAVAMVVYVVPWRYIPVLGLLAAAFVLTGMAIAGTDDRLIRPADLGPFAGTWMQLLGLLIAITAAVIAIVSAARTAPQASQP